MLSILGTQHCIPPAAAGQGFLSPKPTPETREAGTFVTTKAPWKTVHWSSSTEAAASVCESASRVLAAVGAAATAPSFSADWAKAAPGLNSPEGPREDCGLPGLGLRRQTASISSATASNSGLSLVAPSTVPWIEKGVRPSSMACSLEVTCRGVVP